MNHCKVTWGDAGCPRHLKAPIFKSLGGRGVSGISLHVITLYASALLPLLGPVFKVHCWALATAWKSRRQKRYPRRAVMNLPMPVVEEPCVHREIGQLDALMTLPTPVDLHHGAGPGRGNERGTEAFEEATIEVAFWAIIRSAPLAKRPTSSRSIVLPETMASSIPVIAGM